MHLPALFRASQLKFSRKSGLQLTGATVISKNAQIYSLSPEQNRMPECLTTKEKFQFYRSFCPVRHEWNYPVGNSAVYG